jgi:ATP-dependent HslUV protease ATP-binding subunit HslU
MEKVLEDISFRATELDGQTVTIDAAYVRDRMAGVPYNDDVGKYIL